MRLFARTAVTLVTLFATTIGLIRAQPYDDHGLRAFFMPPANCPQPCWQGISPGSTSGTDAYRLLNRQPWVDEIDLYIDLNALAWTWSGTHPAWINANERGVISIDGRGVQYIRIATTLTFADVWLAFGKPDRNRVRFTGLSAMTSLEHTAAYLGGSLYAVGAPMGCEFPMREYWERPVAIVLDNPNANRFASADTRDFDPYDRPYC